MLAYHLTSQGMVFGDMVFSSGQIPVIPATGEVAGATIAEQAEQSPFFRYDQIHGAIMGLRWNILTEHLFLAEDYPFRPCLRKKTIILAASITKPDSAGTAGYARNHAQIQAIRI